MDSKEKVTPKFKMNDDLKDLLACDNNTTGPMHYALKRLLKNHRADNNIFYVKDPLTSDLPYNIIQEMSGTTLFLRVTAWKYLCQHGFTPHTK